MSTENSATVPAADPTVSPSPCPVCNENVLLVDKITWGTVLLVLLGSLFAALPAGLVMSMLNTTRVLSVSPQDSVFSAKAILSAVIFYIIFSVFFATYLAFVGQDFVNAFAFGGKFRLAKVSVQVAQ